MTAVLVPFWIALGVVFITAGPAGAESSLTVDRERLSGIADDSPLNRSGDKEGWDYLFGLLREHSERSLEQGGAETVGFAVLDRQPVEYRGRPVRIEGRLLRCEWTPSPRRSEPFGSNHGARPGFYESWVLVQDRRDIPISVCSLEIPAGFPLGAARNERVSVVGFFYKRRLFLTAEGEEYTAPTILAKTFRQLPAASGQGDAGAGRSRNAAGRFFWQGVVVLAVVWLSFRLFRRYFLPSRRTSKARIRFRLGDSASPPAEKAPVDGPADDCPDNGSVSPGTIGPAVVLGLLFFGIADLDAVGREPRTIDAEFTKTMLLQMDDFDWNALDDETVSLESQREPVLAMLDRLRRFVPPTFLDKNVAASFSPESARAPSATPAPRRRLSVLVADPAQFRGKAFRLKGRVVRVEEIPLNPAERKNYAIPAVYRCRFLVGEDFAEILTAFVPSEWKRNESVRYRAAVTGIFTKRVPMPDAHGEAAKVAQAGDTPADGTPDFGIFDTRTNFVPLLVAPRIQWFPDSFLGDLGMDVGSLEQVPALKISDLRKSSLDVPSTLALLGRDEILRRAFKLTEADREPFYGLLKAASLTPPGRIEREAREELERSGRKTFAVAPLFNDPAGMRGKPVLLHGVAKQVFPTLVEDREVRARYGIEKYYQIYFFTDDSQGNPLVACVTSLPEGMPHGASPDYAERITIAAFPYKLWVYMTSDKPASGDEHKPGYAPLLIGRAPIWHPKDAAPPLVPEGLFADSKTSVSLVIFAILILVWIFFRRYKTRRSSRRIEFRLKK